MGRNKNVPVLTFDECLDLIDRLDTPYSREFKKKCRDVLKRYFAGDESLVNEIRANAKSDNLLAQACRNELAAEGRLATVMDVDQEVRLASKNVRLEQIKFELEQAKIQGVFDTFKTIAGYDVSGIPPQFANEFSELQKQIMGGFCSFAVHGAAAHVAPQPRFVNQERDNE